MNDNKKNCKKNYQKNGGLRFFVFLTVFFELNAYRIDYRPITN